MWDDMLRGNEVDIVNPSDRLQFEVPFREFLWCQIETVHFVRNVIILAEAAPQITARKKDAARSVVTLKAGFCNTLIR